MASGWFAGAIRVAVAGALATVGLLLIAWSQMAQAASPSADGCPDGYHFERMSGVGCVQTGLPPNARYSYTSAAICNEPYVGVHAPGPNAYGSDPNTTYLVECITQEEYAARASASTRPSAAPRDGGDGTLSDASSSPGIVDDLARALLGDNVLPPDPVEADLGGVTATGVLLLSLGAAVMLGSSGGGGLSGVLGGGASGGGGGGAAGGAGSGAGGVMGAAGGTSAGAVPLISAGLPADKSQLALLGLSIFRSMKKVTSEVDPDSLNAGDVAQLMGDAAGVAALATVMAPALGAVALAAGGLAAAVESRSPKDVVNQMRRNLGRIGYMQGVVDEGISQKEGRLAGLGAPASTPAAEAAPPSNLGALSARELQAARTVWAARADSAFDALTGMHEELGDLDDSRQNLALQIDEVGDLLTRLSSAGDLAGASGSVTLPAHLGSVLLYGRGWHLVDDPSRMGAAFAETRARARAAVAAAGQRPAQRPRSGAADSASTGSGAGGAVPFEAWAAANGIGNGRMAVLEALAGLERWRGFYDALASSIDQRLSALRARAEEAGATRRAIAAAIQQRALEGGSK